MLIIFLVSIVLVSGCIKTIEVPQNIKLPENCKLANNEVICTSTQQEIPLQNGVLYGKVTISDCDPRAMKAFCQYFNQPEDYTLRKIKVSYSYGDILYPPEEIGLDENGYYITSLKPGTYLIDINYYSNKSTPDRSLDVATTIIIEEDKITKFNIYIYLYRNQL